MEQTYSLLLSALNIVGFSPLRIQLTWVDDYGKALTQQACTAGGE